jgi:hypothetical protein
LRTAEVGVPVRRLLLKLSSAVLAEVGVLKKVLALPV